MDWFRLQKYLFVFFLLLFSRFNIFFLIIAGVAWAEKDLSKGNEEAV